MSPVKRNDEESATSQSSGADVRVVHFALTLIFILLGWLITANWRMSDELAKKVNKSDVMNRWTTEQMFEYKLYVESRLTSIDARITSNTNRLDNCELISARSRK